MTRPETRVAGRVEGMRGTKATAGAARRAKRARTRMILEREGLCGVGLFWVVVGGWVGVVGFGFCVGVLGSVVLFQGSNGHTGWPAAAHPHARTVQGHHPEGAGGMEGGRARGRGVGRREGRGGKTKEGRKRKGARVAV